MPDQIVEITQPGLWLQKSHGFLEVRKGSEKLGHVALDDLLAVIISVPGASLSSVLIDQLCQRNVPLVICGADYLPSSLTLPVVGQGRQFTTMRAQAALSEPRRKRAWQKIVRAKIRNQAEALARFGGTHNALLRLATQVKSGDPRNHEGQAARIYWQCMFGEDFRRDRHSPGINVALNYSYAVLRACVARGLNAAGLHPSFSVHHKNPQNPFNLADDFIEPFRPIADVRVREMDPAGLTPLTPERKAGLAAVTNVPTALEGEISPLSLVCVKVARGFADYCTGDANDFPLPDLSGLSEPTANETSRPP